MNKDRTFTEKGTGPEGYDTNVKVGERVLVLHGVHAGKEGLVTLIQDYHINFLFGNGMPSWTVVLDDGKVLIYGSGYLTSADYASKMRAIAEKLKVKP